MHTRSRVVRRTTPSIHVIDTGRDAMLVGRAFAKRRHSAAPSAAHQQQRKREKPAAKARTTTDEEETGQSGQSVQQAPEPPSRGLHDFSSVVLEASRRASCFPPSSAALSPYRDSLSEFDPGRLFTSPQRRRVVNVSDHKTCALLMARMKEANRQLPSPSG